MPGCASASLATISATFFEGVLFLGARGLRVARSWLLDRPADRLQGFPATLRGELFQAQLIGHPACDLGARPKSAIGRRFAQTDTKPFQQLRLQNRRNATVVSSLISQRCGSERVVAFEQLFDPALPERSDISDLARRMPLRQQKNRLKMPQRRHVLAALATRLQLRNAQMVDDPSHVRLPRIMALPSIILIPPPESPLVESIARKPYEMMRISLFALIFATASIRTAYAQQLLDAQSQWAVKWFNEDPMTPDQRSFRLQFLSIHQHFEFINAFGSGQKLLIGSV